MKWHQAPFVRLLLPLCVGIVTALYINVLQLFLITSLGSLAGLGVLAWWAYRQQMGWKTVQYWGFSASLVLVALGYSLTYLHQWTNYKTHFESYIYDSKPMIYRAMVAQPPQLRASNVRIFLSIQSVQDSSGNWHDANGMLMSSVALDSAAGSLAYGDELLIQSTIRPMAVPLNPQGLDLRTYYWIQYTYHQTYIPAKRWARIATQKGTVFNQNLYQFRDYLVAIFKQHCPTANEYAVASALILGVRNDLNSEVVNAYADTGAMHVLSVSGLHVGMIAWVLVWIFARIKTERKGWILLRTGLVLLLIWLFAILTGATPPALRSSAMFSFVVVGQLLNRNTNIYNSLASSAFFLLLYNPLWLVDVGFQLSYLALWGIVYFHPHIYKRFYIANKLGDWAWNLTAVSIAATISTLPISLYYFHQFSFITFISGLVVIPISTIILPLGMLLLCVNVIPYVSTLVGMLMYWLIWLLNASVFAMQQIPYAIVEGFWLTRLEMLLWYAVIALVTWALITKRLRGILYASLLTVGLGANYCYTYYQAGQQREICIYNVYKGSAMSYIHGYTASTWVDTLHQQPTSLQFMQQNYLWASKVFDNQLFSLLHDTTLRTEFAIQRRAVFQLDSLRLAIFSPRTLSETPQPLDVDYIWIQQNISPKRGARYLQQMYAFKGLIVDASNSRTNAQRWQHWADSVGVSCWNVAEQGAWVWRGE